MILFPFSDDLFSPYNETINVIFRELPELKELPGNFFTLFPNLQYLKLSACDKLKVIPFGIAKCSNLELVCLEHSGFESFPDDILRIPSLLRLHCSDLCVCYYFYCLNYLSLVGNIIYLILLFLFPWIRKLNIIV